MILWLARLAADDLASTSSLHATDRFQTCLKSKAKANAILYRRDSQDLGRLMRLFSAVRMQGFRPA
ncbi:MAG: hypothetical protein DMG93_04000 [Acidobacteria bacterium]|nr:MAG: hypothetical protein DMG93_04000 [Acidobacteriota bacterium]